MRLEVPFSLAESLAVSTAAISLHLPCVMGYAGELRISSMEIPDDSLEAWWITKDEFRWALRHCGVPAGKARDLVLDIWRVLGPLKDSVRSTRHSFIRSAK